MAESERAFLVSLEQPLPEGCIDVDLGFTPSTTRCPSAASDSPLAKRLACPLRG
jgi:hypothetical protein